MVQPEKTLPQRVASVSVIFGGKLVKSTTLATYKTYRLMRKDPTIGMARQLLMAPILASGWSVLAEEDAPEGAKEFINAQVTKIHLNLLSSALQGCIDFGWQAYEKVFEVGLDGRIGIKKLKPLIHDFTDIMVDENTGAFAGLQQKELRLQVEESLLLYIDPEGTDWYGQSVMESARLAYNKWNATDEGAERYDQKIAGSHWVVHYPPGVSQVEGTDVDNLKVAKDIVDTLESSGAIIVPRVVAEFVDDSNRDQPDAWKVELMSDGGPKQYSFVARLKYLDTLKVRAFGLPERSVLEGSFGTKAEAEAHANFAITNMELRHKLFVELINWHLVNQLLRLNFGEGTDSLVYIQAAPITDMARTFLRNLYVEIIRNPSGFVEEFGSIDLEGLKDQLEIPTTPENELRVRLDVDDSGDEPNPTALEEI